jgi:hypothetical protein
MEFNRNNCSLDYRFTVSHGAETCTQAAPQLQQFLLFSDNMTPGGRNSMQIHAIVKQNNGLQVSATAAKCMPGQEPQQTL